ncbi:MAG: MBL fold metallo-hydrolase [Cyanobacteria bacterium P01_G01_bin.38]
MSSVSYEFFRNVTAKLFYNGLTLLLDPMLSKKGTLPSFAGIAANPIIDLPISEESILDGIDAVLVSHMHVDHFDSAAADKLPKDVPIFTPDNQAPTDLSNPLHSGKTFLARLTEKGFTNVTTMAPDNCSFKGVLMTQEFGQHGIGKLGQMMGGVNGIILQAQNQPTIYWTSDTILDEDGHVEAILRKYQPDIVIAHTGGAVINSIAPDPLMMDEAQAVKFFQLAKQNNQNAVIVAVHMQALDHCFTTRDSLKMAITSLPENTQKDIYMPVESEKIALNFDAAMPI